MIHLCKQLHILTLSLNLNNEYQTEFRRKAIIHSISLTLKINQHSATTEKLLYELLAFHLCAFQWPKLWGLSPEQTLQAEFDFLKAYPSEPFNWQHNLEKYAISLLIGHHNISQLLKIIPQILKTPSAEKILTEVIFFLKNEKI